MAILTRDKLRELSSLRRKDAKTLLDSGHFAGSYYLMGYSVECALKAMIAAQVRQNDFPDKKLANQAYTHDLDALVGLAGLRPTLDADMRQSNALRVNWTVVKDWTEALRYELAVSDKQARDFYKACTTRPNGILTWVRRQW